MDYKFFDKIKSTEIFSFENIFKKISALRHTKRDRKIDRERARETEEVEISSKDHKDHESSMQTIK